MDTLSWIVAGVAVAVLIAWYLSYGAARLDRLHARVEGALSALDAQLVRRAEATLELANSGSLDPASALILAGAASDSLEADGESQTTREAIESDLTQALEVALGEEALRQLRGSPQPTKECSWPAGSTMTPSPTCVGSGANRECGCCVLPAMRSSRRRSRSTTSYRFSGGVSDALTWVLAPNYRKHRVNV